MEVDEEEIKSEVVEKPRKTTRSKKAAAPAEAQEEEEEKKVKVDVEETVDKSEDTQAKQTTFSAEMPIKLLPDAPSAEDTEQMIAKAKEMVQEAVDSKAAKEEVAETSTPKGAKKRKTDDLSEESEDEETEAASAQRVKRAKVLEEKLKRERVRNRALVGVTAAFALAASIPYFF